MDAKTRMALAMRGERPDRVPLMCQFSLGFLAKNFAKDLVRFWYTPEGLAEAYIAAAEHFGFDGILVNVVGRDPERIGQIQEIEDSGDRSKKILWKNGIQTLVRHNDDPINYGEGPRSEITEIDELDLDQVPGTSQVAFPDYGFNILESVLKQKGKELSIHGEVGTGFEMFLMLFAHVEDGLVALVEDPEKSKEALERLNRVVIASAREQCRMGIDALKLSSPFAGAGFISRDMYREFVLPYEKEVIAAAHQEADIPCYIHTCGAIGDRLDLMLETGTNGLECLDPPPLGTVDLKEAVRILGSKAFIKGNLDSVNELLHKTPEEVLQIAKDRVKIGREHSGGYILSTACSIAPDVPVKNIEILQEAVTG